MANDTSRWKVKYTVTSDVPLLCSKETNATHVKSPSPWISYVGCQGKRGYHVFGWLSATVSYVIRRLLPLKHRNYLDTKRNSVLLHGCC